MGAKKKGKKKSSSNAGKKVAKSDHADVSDSDGIDVKSLHVSKNAPVDNVSSLLFGSKSEQFPLSLPYIGPISLVERGASGTSSSAISHGRGLVTTRDVSPGECLFITPSIVAADATDVRRQYLREVGDGGTAVDLEHITEEHLVEKVLSLCEILEDEEIQPKENVDHARRLLTAFTAQMSSEYVPKMESSNELMDILVAKDSTMAVDGNKDNASLDRDTILSIIRRNAFGPDYHNYDKIEECWTKRVNSEHCYNRLLGVYPLSAMINHSCSPNAVRVFGCIPSHTNNNNGKASSSSDIDKIQGREVMIVHANANIPKGTEITWSYLPPSTPFVHRREALILKYGFTCKCTRCTKEEEALRSASEFKELLALADGYWSSSQHGQQGDGTMISLVPSIEKIFMSKQLSNEAQRYLRVGYSRLYVEFFNAAISLENEESLRSTLQMATQLHFSFASCNNASTEQLSILHLCYDLSTNLRSLAVKSNCSDAVISRTMTQVRFWTEQLRLAHMVRYGALGEDLETVRDVMKHTKLVLRNQEGWYLAKDRFI